jgi:hypothetical protein
MYSTVGKAGSENTGRNNGKCTPDRALVGFIANTIFEDCLGFCWKNVVVVHNFYLSYV